MSVFVPLSTQPVLLNGVPQVGAQISIYNAGTLTPRSAFADSYLTTALAQPVLSDSNGCIPVMWITGNPYRVRIVAPSGVFLRDVDNLPGDAGPLSPPPPPPPPGALTLATGDLIWTYGTGIKTGCVHANGKTIGNASSGASERANSDTQNLFNWLWNGDPNLPVIGGRGGTALADWNANKAITLPDFNGRAAFGIDGMNASATGRLNAGLFSAGNAGTLGSTGGESGHTLVVAEQPSHTHTATTQSAGSHQHTFTSNTAGAHNHTGATGYENQNHQHTGTTDSENATHYHGIALATDTQGSHSHGGATGGQTSDHHHGLSVGGSSLVNTGAVLQAMIAGSSNTGGTSNDHAHAISTDGAHAHNVGGNSGTQSANHQHTFTSGTETVAHNHNISTDGTHSHTGVVDAAGIHTHTLTSDPTGGGGAHNTLPPFILVTVYIVL